MNDDFQAIRKLSHNSKTVIAIFNYAKVLVLLENRYS